MANKCACTTICIFLPFETLLLCGMGWNVVHTTASKIGAAFAHKRIKDTTGNWNTLHFMPRLYLFHQEHSWWQLASQQLAETPDDCSGESLLPPMLL